MTINEEIYYLDTSALVKRYVTEPGSDIVDEIFTRCYRGLSKLSFSYWNVAEAAVVFDKYEKKLNLNAKKLLLNLLREMKTLARLHRLMLVDVSPKVLRQTIKLVLKYHIYVADALQLASAAKVGSKMVVTGDRSLAKIASHESFQVIYVG
jgi:predicted nucleic acid-binding protein